MVGSPVKSIFLDSSVLFAASTSRTGASALIFAYCKRLRVKGYISPYVVIEVKRNIYQEKDQKIKQRLNVLLLQAKLQLVIPTPVQIAACETVINQKDAPILAAALKAQVDYLVSLDKKDFFQQKVKEFIKPVTILTPKHLLSRLM